MEKSVQLKTDLGDKLILVISGAEGAKGIVLLCHGFMSDQDSSTNREMTSRLAKKGIATARFDFFGHGKEGSPIQELTFSKCLAQAETALAYLVENNFGQIGLLGSSFGGLVAIHTAARHKEIIVVGLKCPVSNYPPLWQDRFGESGIVLWEETGRLTFMGLDGKCRLNWAFYKDLLSYNSYEEASLIEAPTLIVHGDADEDVPSSQSEALFEALQSEKRFEHMAGADHPFSNDAHFDNMLNHFEQWFLQKLGVK